MNQSIGTTMKAKVNSVGAIATVLVLISLFLPWWTLNVSSSALFITISVSLNYYPWGFMTSGYQLPTPDFRIHELYLSLVLAIIGIIEGTCGSIILENRSSRFSRLFGRKKGHLLSLRGGSYSIFLSAFYFVFWVYNNCRYGIFFNRQSLEGSALVTSSAHLNFGFFLALVGASLLLVSSFKHPEAS